MTESPTDIPIPDGPFEDTTTNYLSMLTPVKPDEFERLASVITLVAEDPKDWLPFVNTDKLFKKFEQAFKERIGDTV